MNTKDTNIEIAEMPAHTVEAATDTTATDTTATVAEVTDAAADAAEEVPEASETINDTAGEVPKASEAADADAPQKKRMAFWKKLTLYCAAWLVLIGAACAVMWNIMEQYEAAQPWYAVEAYLHTSAKSAFHTALEGAYPDTQNPYESVEEIAEDLFAAYGDSLTYKKLIREYTYESPVYLLQSGDTALLKLTLTEGDATGFLGLRGYTVQSVELVASERFSLSSYGLVFPTGAEVLINGKPLTADTASCESACTVFGSEAYTACTLENFFERPSVKVVYAGVDLPESGSDDFIFADPENPLRTVTVTAPADAAVYIDGKRVSEYFCTDTSETEPDRFGAVSALCTYTVPTVCGEGVLTVTQDGVQLAATESDNAWTALPNTLSRTVVLPADAILYANGIAVDRALITDTNTAWNSIFTDVRSYPSAVTYTLTDLHAIPELTATLGDAELFPTEDDNNTVFVCAADETLKAAYTEQAIAFMNAYLYYTTQGYVNTRANLDAVKALVASPSPLYTNLERSYIGYYYIAPQKMKVEYMQVDTFIPYGEDAFTCSLSYKIELSNWVGTTTEENTMCIAFARSGGKFAPVNMILAEETN